MFSPGLPLSFSNKPESWIHRVRENPHLALQAVKVRPAIVNGAPLHFDRVDLSVKGGTPQTISAGVHVAIIAALALAAVSGPKQIIKVEHGPREGVSRLAAYIPPLTPQGTGQGSLGSNGGGGENDPRPARFGQLAPGSSMPLAPPRLNRNE
jgi:hypothetical protein